VYALTVTNKSTQNQTKPRAIFAVPHAHEPAGTAVMHERNRSSSNMRRP